MIPVLLDTFNCRPVKNICLTINLSNFKLQGNKTRVHGPGKKSDAHNCSDCVTHNERICMTVDVSIDGSKTGFITSDPEMILCYLNSKIFDAVMTLNTWRSEIFLICKCCDKFHDSGKNLYRSKKFKCSVYEAHSCLKTYSVRKRAIVMCKEVLNKAFFDLTGK